MQPEPSRQMHHLCVQSVSVSFNVVKHFKVLAKDMRLILTEMAKIPEHSMDEETGG